jgi:hypothetical protein
MDAHVGDRLIVEGDEARTGLIIDVFARILRAGQRDGSPPAGPPPSL